MARILYFGIARDLAGTAEETLLLARPHTLDEFWIALLDRHPSLERVRPICRLAVDMNYADPGIVVDDRSELAIIPPVSGG